MKKMKSVLLLAAIMSSCATVDRGTCEAGRQVECACPDGPKGVQTCLPDGSGWGECQCVCEKDCTDMDCGLDPVCGESCGECFNICTDEDDPSLCVDGRCEEACCPDCEWRECGDDGCEGVCPPGCGADQVCNAGGRCVCEFVECGDACCAEGQVCVGDTCCSVDCGARECGPDAACGVSCGVCQENELCSESGQCLCEFEACGGGCCAEGQVCAAGACCTPDCQDRECGPDPVCKSKCGDCSADQDCTVNGVCIAGCVPQCGGRVCGPDPVCAVSCGECPAGAECNLAGQCISDCLPDCAGRDCGPDPVCGIICGYCPGNDLCLPDGQCQQVCDEIEIGFGQIAPNLMLVIDKSGSMNDPTSAGSSRTKIQDAVDALNLLLNEAEGSIRFGWIQFPEDDMCAPGTVSVSIGDDSVPQILTMVNALTALGGTPTGESLQAANADPALHDVLRDNFVLLMTDGMPTCPNGNGREVTQEDCDLALQGVVDLHDNAVDTFVIGLGEDLNAANPELLNQMAEAGGRPRPGAIKYYQANSLAELQLVLQDISGIIIGCNLLLDVVPEYPDYLWVYFDGVPVPRDINHTNGWDYDADTNRIDFYGPTCDQLRSGMVGTVNIIMGCAPPN